MLLHDSRRAARTGDDGDSCCWRTRTGRAGTQKRIDEGLRVLERAASRAARRPVPAAGGDRGRARAGSPWSEIATLYDRLVELDPSPVVELNRAVAEALAGASRRASRSIGGLDGLDGYHLLHAARADLLRRLERREEAAAEYRRALELTANEAESRYLERRLLEVS